MPIARSPARCLRPLLLLGLVAGVLASCRDRSAPIGPLRHVLLVSMDTTRADQVTCYGAQQALTPAMDGLAARGVRFASATTAANTTLAAHTSLMTGSWPHTHGVARNGFVVNDTNVMLAEILSEAGFHTSGVLGSFALESRFHFDQGFDHYDEQFDVLVAQGAEDQNQRRGDRVTEAALAHVDRVKGEAERLFMFVHYFDAHAPYAPPEPFAAPFLEPGQATTSDMFDVDAAVRSQQQAVVGQAFGHAGAINAGLRGPLRGLVGKMPGVPGPSDEHLAALYAGEVRFQDHALGELLAGLEERGILQNTLVIVTADHGETFWEHEDLWNHGLALYQTTVHVPLLFAFPDGRYEGMTVTTPVSTIDVLPTLCELLGLDLPERSEGMSLVSLMNGRRVRRGPVFSEATQPWIAEVPGTWFNANKARCVRRGRWKYVVSPYNQVEQLFDLRADPGERTNVLEASPDAQVLGVRDDLRRELLEWQSARNPLPSSFDSSQSAETMERLKAMGYTGENEESDK